MRDTARILFLPSHIGLGHVTRDYRVAVRLRAEKPGVRINWCTGFPASSYLVKRGENVVKECLQLYSMSVIAEEYVEKKLLYRPWVLRGYSELLKKNITMLDDHIDWDSYDLIIADEYWELMLGAGKKARPRTMFATDIVFKQYALNPIENGLSYVLNTYFERRYKEFPYRVFIGLLEDVPNQRIGLFIGENMREWVKRNFWIVGRIPSIDEVYKKMSVHEARRRLGLDEYKRIITVLVGGTSADSHNFFSLIERFWKEFLQKHPDSLLISILGPRTRYSFSTKSTITLGLVSDPGLYLVASDLVISRGGRTTVTDLEYLGVPSIIVPIRNHFEQEFLSKQEAVMYPNIIHFGEKWEYERLLRMVEKILKMGRINNPPMHFLGDKVVSKTIMRLLH